jgi:hypothetical protein
MRRLPLLVLLLLPAFARADLIVDFEDLGLPASSYDNGSGGAGGFSSRGVFFRNSYDPTYQSWYGFAASTMTNTTDPSYTNQYSAFPGSGSGGSRTFAVAFGYFPNDLDPGYYESYVNLPDGYEAVSLDVANTTYAALTVRDGDPYGFSKKFGGRTGNDPDLFRLVILGFDTTFSSDGANPGSLIGSVAVNLADYRFADNSLDYVLSHWLTADLSSLAGARALGFRLETTDVGPYGPNTPAYFALDNLRLRSLPTVAVPEPSGIALALSGLIALLAPAVRRGMKRG